MKTILMLVENKNNGYERILKYFHQHLCDKLIKKLIPKIARTKFGGQAMTLMMKSHCFRGLFWEKVTNHGLFKLEGSFESFFQKYLASACEAGKDVARAVIEELKNPPFNVAFGLYCIKRENHML